MARVLAQVIEVERVVVVADPGNVGAKADARRQRVLVPQPPGRPIVGEEFLRVVRHFVVIGQQRGAAPAPGFLAEHPLELGGTLEAPLGVVARPQQYVQALARRPEEGQLELGSTAAAPGELGEQEAALAFGLDRKHQPGRVEHGDVQHAQGDAARDGIATHLEVGQVHVDLPGSAPLSGGAAAAREGALLDPVAVRTAPHGDLAGHLDHVRVDCEPGRQRLEAAQIDGREVRPHLAVGLGADHHIARGGTDPGAAVDRQPVGAELAARSLRDHHMAHGLVDPAPLVADLVGADPDRLLGLGHGHGARPQQDER